MECWRELYPRKKVPLGKETGTHPVDRRSRDSSNLRMKGLIDARCVTAESFEVIMVEKVDGQSAQTIRDIARKTGSLPMMIGQILADFPVEIIRREKRIGIVARCFGIDGLMDDAMPLILGAEHRVMIQDTHIFWFLIGRDDKRDKFCARPNDTERVEYFPECSRDAAMLERTFRIELTCASSLP